MTDLERQIIGSTLQTLTELVYGLKRNSGTLTNEQIEELNGYEQTLLSNIERLRNPE